MKFLAYNKCKVFFSEPSFVFIMRMLKMECIWACLATIWSLPTLGFLFQLPIIDE